MPLVTKRVTTEVIDYYKCNRCDKVIYSEEFEAADVFYHRDIGGYCSKWGDMISYEIVLCPSCAYDILSPYSEIKELQL